MKAIKKTNTAFVLERGKKVFVTVGCPTDVERLDYTAKSAAMNNPSRTSAVFSVASGEKILEYRVKRAGGFDVIVVEGE